MAGRLLIAVGNAASNQRELPFGVRQLIDAASEVMVVAPALPGRLQWLVSDTDEATQRADERLQAVLGHLADVPAPVRGRVGSDDPIEAFADAIREFEPDHLLVRARPGDRAGWQEHGLIDSLLERFGLPVTVFEVPAD